MTTIDPDSGPDGQAHEPHPANPDGGAPEPVWTFRGYRLKPAEFNTAMVHLFRAEISRANVWRQRLDTTTNWAVVATGAALTVAFGQQSGSHIIILLNTVLISFFLYIEARRYRYYELWSTRVRLMETDFFAAMLVPPFQPDPDWAESLAENLLHPDYPISFMEALGRRLRRNYLWIYIILGFAWSIRIWLLPAPASSYAEFVSRAALGTISGEVVIAIVTGYYIVLGMIALLTVGLHEASGEILPRYLGLLESARTAEVSTLGGRVSAWFRPSRKRKQLMALMITDRAKEVSSLVLEEMRRGVTAFDAKGMYTGSPHTMLMVALTISEVNHLKSLVHQADPKAFVIVTPVQELLGGEFMPLVGKK